jgi:prepilin-type N-terminal cleavage/methylation domain-containing protein
MSKQKSGFTPAEMESHGPSPWYLHLSRLRVARPPSLLLRRARYGGRSKVGGIRRSIPSYAQCFGGYPFSVVPTPPKRLRRLEGTTKDESFSHSPTAKSCGLLRRRIKFPNRRRTGFQKAFTLIELLVVIAIIAVLMSILMPAINRVKKQAKTIACQASLHQWALFWSMYTSDYDGKFFDEMGGESTTSVDRWPQVLEPLYKSVKMRLCPVATKTQAEGGINPFMAWYTSDTVGGVTTERKGSYGLNEWLSNHNSGGYSGNYWKNVNAKPANNIPVFLDCAWYDVWVFHDNQPPLYDGDLTNGNGRGPPGEMKRVCLNRHDGFVDCLFLDWSIRKVGLKELWTLNWHKTFNTRNTHTKAGGVWPTDWPLWMRRFKDY